MLDGIRIQQPSLALSLSASQPTERFAYGARSEAAVYVGDLLQAEVPSLRDGELELVAIARRPGVLSKVAIRAPVETPLPMTVGIGADHVARVRAALDGERIDVVVWQRSAPPYIADALGLVGDQPPPIVLLPALGHAHVLLGEIDVRGIAGWRDLNVILASALTGWRIRLEPVAATAAWTSLRAAQAARRVITATVVGRTEHGVRVEVGGLFAILSSGASDVRRGQELEVRITRMDADEGRIFVTDRLIAVSQPRLPLT